MLFSENRSGGFDALAPDQFRYTGNMKKITIISVGGLENIPTDGELESISSLAQKHKRNLKYITKMFADVSIQNVEAKPSDCWLFFIGSDLRESTSLDKENLIQNIRKLIKSDDVIITTHAALRVDCISPKYVLEANKHMFRPPNEMYFVLAHNQQYSSLDMK